MKKRKDGRWEQAIPLGRQSDGKLKYHHVCAKSRAELEEKVKELESQLDLGIDISQRKPTLGEWSIQWLETEKSDKGQKTYWMYKSMVYNHIIPTLGNAAIDKVRAIDIKQLLNQKSKTMSKKTLHVLLITLRQIFKAAVINQYIARNYMDHVTAPANEKVSHREALDKNQVQALIRVSERHPYGKLPMIMLHCGLRRGEALALKKTDIGSDTISVNKSFDYSSNQPTLKSPKTKAGIRSVPIPEPLRPFLKQQPQRGYTSSKRTINRFQTHNIAIYGTVS